MSSQRVLDVSHLPESAWDAKAPLWWANTLLLVIETSMFGILAASYFYVRMNFQEWPPPHVNRLPVLYDTNPDLLWGTINSALLLLSCIPVFFLDKAARRLDSAGVKRGLTILILTGCVAIALRFLEFKAIHFLWDDNAYASVVWMLLGAHLLHLIVASLEGFVTATHVFTHRLDEKRALDVTVSCAYWYWVVGIWLITYGLVYFGARLL
jgi:cytochrome c oxidase subunit III